MKRKLTLTLLPILIISFLVTNLLSMSNLDSIDKIKILSSDIPAGFQVGKIPGFAKQVLKNNPWKLDHYAISKLAHRIYPGGEKNNISDVHMTILASKKNPYGDDIVCYIFRFKDNKKAKIETKKIKDFVKYNRDRSILLEKNLMAVYLMVDSAQDYPLIETLSKSIKSKMDTL